MDEATLKKVQERLADLSKSFRKQKVKQVYIKMHNEWQKTKGNANTIYINRKGSYINEAGNKLPLNFATFDCTKLKVHSTKSNVGRSHTGAMAIPGWWGKRALDHPIKPIN